MYLTNSMEESFVEKTEASELFKKFPALYEPEELVPSTHSSKIFPILRIYIKVKESHTRSGVAQRFSGVLGSQIS
jgi:hypothetical protein